MPHASTLPRLSAAVLVCAFAGPLRAETDAHRYASPDGAFYVANIGDTAAPECGFEVREQGGRVLLASAARPADFSLPSFAKAVRWSSDGRLVAFAAQTSGPYIRDTFVFSVASGSLVRVPTPDDDHQSAPVRWSGRSTLLVSTRFPIGGKADHSTYRYRRTVRFRDTPLRCEIVRAERPTRE